ncbi:MAG: hypothetical protein JO089_06555 [Alphaproteobacteria bacterium]|nr:hypothetical protein [Alphaproteobacteria bacterium]
MDRLDGRLIAARLRGEYKFVPVIATEIEFYLHQAPQALEPFWRNVCESSANESIDAFKIEKESGPGQYEVALRPQRDVAEIVRQTVTLKTILARQAEAHGMRADFSALPLLHQPGSGLHIHVHLENEAGESMYYKKNAAISDALRWSIGGLLATMHEFMSVFAPTPEALARLKGGVMAPSTLSWGANNRTVAVRLPDGGAPYRHIEHRVASADADVAHTVAAVLSGIYYGLAHRCDPGAQTYGDASLPVYALPRLVE